MIKIFIYLSLFCLPESGWDLLAKVEFVAEYDEMIGQEVDIPQFSDELRAMEGKELELEGYVIPLEANLTQDYFVLSKYPFKACFFCGNAGPETVVEVYSEGEFKVTDQRVRAKGTLVLNQGDPFRLAYVLEDAKVEIIK